MTTTVRRCTSMLLSLSARMRRGTRTARAGDLTSATKVVDERDLMQAGTESGFDMHFTRAGIWGTRSGLARVVQRDVAHFMAAFETCQTVIHMNVIDYCQISPLAWYHA
jgi:hypothetical protein